jgi:hypothetical protein
MARQIRSFFLALLLFGAMLVSQLAVAQPFHDKAKLVGTGLAVQQGYSVAASGGDNTALVGGPLDQSAWVFILSSGGFWIQQAQLAPPAPVTPGSVFGTSVALSSNGNTAIIGDSGDSSNAGAAWVFTRSSNGVWTQLGDKLVGAGVPGSLFGTSVALSNDGNTALVGEPGNGAVGAAWVFTPSNGVWKQHGGDLVGNNANGAALQGSSVALSGDGFTALIGGPGDSSNAGATWVFTRSNAGVWTQKGSKLVGTGASSAAEQGISVALSTHGTTAIVGGPADVGGGAAWVFTLVRGGWIQQGGKLVGSGFGGRSVAMSGDGSTAIVGSPGDNSNTGAVRAYTRSTKGLWTQLGSVITGDNASSFGFSASLSTLGRTLLIGAPTDNTNIGAAWVYLRPQN